MLVLTPRRLCGVQEKHDKCQGKNVPFSTGKDWEANAGGKGPLSHITVIIDAAGIKEEAEGQRNHEAQKDLCYYKPNQI